MHCERKRAYTSAEHAGRVAASRQAEGAPQLHPYHCPECGCYHLSKMDRIDALRLTPKVLETTKHNPLPEPTTKDQRIAEATGIIRAERGNYIGQDNEEARWLVTLASGESVVAVTNLKKRPKVLSIEEPTEEARTMYPAILST